MSGLLISVDGPSGLGKSTAVAATARALAASGHTVHTATGPSTTPYGTAVRQAAATMRGRALALAVAADRLHQLDTDIRPHRAAGATVLMDRWMASTLVLQRADGVDVDFLLTINQGTDVPDLAVILTADPDTVQRRLAVRGTRHRFELDATATARELRLYTEAVPILNRLGYRLHTIDTTHLTAEQTAQAILGAVPDRAINTKTPQGSEREHE
ncbi:dTMP kinase [Kitasatospora sp. NPDC059827]|uniref:dTMP kinase n=1 Tax=Kitasatospora sp. NPDC059827 TaxID=3346964 RepID=UPI003645FEAB